MLKGKTIILGVTGSIAAYKAADLASRLVKAHAQVHVIMTKNAMQFISPVTFETLTGNKCLTDTFDRNFSFEVEHISLAKKADLIYYLIPTYSDGESVYFRISKDIYQVLKSSQDKLDDRQKSLYRDITRYMTRNTLSDGDLLILRVEFE